MFLRDTSGRPRGISCNWVKWLSCSCLSTSSASCETSSPGAYRMCHVKCSSAPRKKLTGCKEPSMGGNWRRRPRSRKRPLDVSHRSFLVLLLKKSSSIMWSYISYYVYLCDSHSPGAFKDVNLFIMIV